MSILLLLALLSGAGDGPAPARGDGWEALDAELAKVRVEPATPTTWGVLLRAFATTSAKESAEDTATADVSGFVLEDADAFFAYRTADVAWRVSADVGEGEVELEDAYGSWRHQEWFALSVGRFKPRVMRSASVPPEELLFRERTFLGAAFDDWDEGVEVGGHYDQFDYWLTLANGSSGTRRNHFYSARGEWALNDAAFADREGARGAPNYMRALLGVTWFSDDGEAPFEGDGVAADVAIVYGPYAVHGEWANLHDFAREIDVFNGLPLTLEDGRPLAATISRRLGEVEAAVRYQNADESDATRSLGFGVNWTPSGSLAHVVAEASFVDGDTRDFSLFSLGLVFGSSGLARPFTDTP